MEGYCEEVTGVNMDEMWIPEMGDSILEMIQASSQWFIF